MLICIVTIRDILEVTMNIRKRINKNSRMLNKFYPELDKRKAKRQAKWLFNPYKRPVSESNETIKFGVTDVGYPYVILEVMQSHLCGYIQVPNEAPFNVLDLRDHEDKWYCHGGVTYTGNLLRQDDLWIGFDCAHAGDATRWAPEWGIKRTPEFVMDEINHLSTQFHSYANGDPEIE